MDAWMVRPIGGVAWQVGVVKDGQRVLVAESHGRTLNVGRVLLGMLSEMTWQEVVEWSGRSDSIHETSGR
jgi:hypothetical protein